MPPIPPLALDTCRLIGANPAGPVGSRLIKACGALPADQAWAEGEERAALVSRLIDGATNRETYFFRDRRQLALMGALLRGDTATSAPLALWSAGCATGEEAYSLAILLRGLGLSGSVTGTDVSRAALEAARLSLYRTGPMSPCREVGPLDDSALPLTADGRRAVADPIRAAVRFLEHNILSGPPPPRLFDAVVCRNVLIYMDDAARNTAIQALATAVKPGGLLLLGPGDVAPPVDPVALGFRAFFRDGAGLYIKGRPMVVDAATPAAALASVLAFERRGQVFCCPTADVLEILEEPALDDPGYATPLVAGVLLHGGCFVAAVDPACIFDFPPERRGDAILIRGPAGVVALLADSVLGFRTPTALAPAPWIPAGRMCRSAAMIERIGRAFVLGADGVGDVPAALAASPPTTGPDTDKTDGAGAANAGSMHLVFTIATRAFAARYADVQRILYRQRLFRMPGAQPPMLHAVEVIGAVVPVLDLAEPVPPPERADFVVLTSAAGPLALRVDSIERPLPLVRDATEPGWFPAPGVDGIARLDDRAYSVVTGAALLRILTADPAPREEKP